ncbi:MAG: globin-coupled sensor protein [Rhodospirillales bacterium]|nr:globin-coupled sensor protein [Rhodospirillales bacterium]
MDSVSTHSTASVQTSTAERLEFLKIDQTTRAALVEFRPVLEQHVQGILGKFYDHIRRYPDLVKMFGGDANIDRARGAQATHWMGIFEGRFDQAYAERVRRIGKTHERIGLEPRWYIGGYALAMSELMDVAVKHYEGKPDQLVQALQAMVKALFLDMDFAISIYIEEGKINFTKQLNSLADGFEASVKGVVKTVSASAGEMKGSAQQMATIAEDASKRATAVAAASEEASTNVQTVAAAAEELSSSITEISRQVAQSTSISGQAVQEAERANAQVRTLAETAAKIGDVVKLINAIAGQTNLLALNATIEAARAGEAGKGFAVVASEVKSLANQTAKATGDIAAQVNAIQEATKIAVEAIRSIGGTIGKINEISTTIAAAVEEQNAATGEIARNVQQASAGTSEVSSNIAGVTQAAHDTGKAAAGVLHASESLGEQSSTLAKEVDSFLDKVRAA